MSTAWNVELWALQALCIECIQCYCMMGTYCVWHYGSVRNGGTVNLLYCQITYSLMTSGSKVLTASQ